MSMKFLILYTNNGSKIDGECPQKQKQNNNQKTKSLMLKVFECFWIELPVLVLKGISRWGDRKRSEVS